MLDNDLKKYLKKSPKVVVSVRLDKEVLEWYKKLDRPGAMRAVLTMYSKVERWNNILGCLTARFDKEIEYVDKKNCVPLGCDKQPYIRGLEQGRYLIREWFKSIMDVKRRKR